MGIKLYMRDFSCMHFIIIITIIWNHIIFHENISIFFRNLSWLGRKLSYFYLLYQRANPIDTVSVTFFR